MISNQQPDTTKSVTGDLASITVKVFSKFVTLFSLFPP